MTGKLRLAIVFIVISCACDRSDTQVPVDDKNAAASITIMTFNVENLFDNVDDPDKTDYTFLAL